MNCAQIYRTVTSLACKHDLEAQSLILWHWREIIPFYPDLDKTSDTGHVLSTSSCSYTTVRHFVLTSALVFVFFSPDAGDSWTVIPFYV